MEAKKDIQNIGDIKLMVDEFIRRSETMTYSLPFFLSVFRLVSTSRKNVLVLECGIVWSEGIYRESFF